MTEYPKEAIEALSESKNEEAKLMAVAMENGRLGGDPPEEDKDDNSK